MKKYRCTICGYVYDEAVEKVKFTDLPDDWKCPWCGAPKSMFKEITEENAAPEKTNLEDEMTNTEDENLTEVKPSELAYIFSNLAKSCEKQYLENEEKLFLELSEHYKAMINIENGDLNDIISANEKDNTLINQAFNIADKYADRGSKRVLTWATKTNNIIKAILSEYQEKGSEYLKNNKVWVCDICGFVYVGNTPPEICPICKVPNLKILEVK